jgi:predicted nucleic acid-binding protein
VIVVDASIVVAALADDDVHGRTARRRLGPERLAAPHLIDIEVVAAWRRLAGAGQLGEQRVELARADLRALPIERVPHAPLFERIWELRSNLTAYDAAYVALAETLGVPLLTVDAKLAGAPGPRCAIEVLTA